MVKTAISSLPPSLALPAERAFFILWESWSFTNWNINDKWHFTLTVRQRHYSSNTHTHTTSNFTSNLPKIKFKQLYIFLLYHLNFTSFSLTKQKMEVLMIMLNKKKSCQTISWPLSPHQPHGQRVHFTIHTVSVHPLHHPHSPRPLHCPHRHPIHLTIHTVSASTTLSSSTFRLSHTLFLVGGSQFSFSLWHCYSALGLLPDVKALRELSIVCHSVILSQLTLPTTAPWMMSNSDTSPSRLLSKNPFRNKEKVGNHILLFI